MTLIEGVGDEVTVFVVVLVMLLVLGLAWASTGVTDRPFVSVIVLDGRTFQQFISRLRGRRVVTGTPTEGTPSDASPGTSQTAEGATAEPEHDVALVTAEPTGDGSDVEEEEETCDEASASCGEPGTAASTPGSEGFVHLGGSGSDGESGLPSGYEQPVRQATMPGSESELRQRRLAFFSGNAGSTDSTQRGESISPAAPPEPLPHTEHEQRPALAADPPPVASAAVQPETRDSFIPLDGHIRIRLKYLDDRQRWVQARPEETVGQFKRAHFSAELDENTMIRFIYNGRELTRDGQSLAAYNVSDESVIHCLVSQGGNRPHPANIPPGSIAFDMGTLVYPLFGLILALIWYSRFTYKQYFNTMSTLTLLAISFLFVVALLASLRVQDAPEAAEAD